MHPPMGGGVSTNYKSSTRIELSQLGQDLLNFYSFDLTQPIDPPIHPAMVGVSLQIIMFKHYELNIIELS